MEDDYRELKYMNFEGTYRDLSQYSVRKTEKYSSMNLRLIYRWSQFHNHCSWFVCILDQKREVIYLELFILTLILGKQMHMVGQSSQAIRE
jgi:hypothetical protein